VDAFNADLSNVLRYSLVGKEEFEKSIDADPLEATNHLVYADHLDEIGEHEEAAFRRAMGEWHQNGRYLHSPDGPYGSGENEFPHQASTDQLPSGVEYRLLKHSPDWRVARESPNHAVWQGLPQVVDRPDGTRGVRPGTLGWRTYRDMEAAFRKAFQTGRKSE
jgi:uncharacterized protein (TIGR02996 family)